MKDLSTYHYSKKTIILCLSVIICAGILGSCFSNQKNSEAVKQVKGPSAAYLGSNSCKSCHAKIYDSYLQAAHYKTSSLVDEQRFDKIYKIPDSVFFKKDLFIKVLKDSNRYFQTAISKGINAVNRPFDLVIGSGRKGQTFLFWNNSSIYQLPLSYSFTHNGWINSPGYPADKVIFNRMVPSNCFECHATYASQKTNETQKEIYEKDKLVLSIACESCHGAGERHVNFHLDNPEEKTAQYILNTKKMNRVQQLDACAVCHSGLRKNKKQPFSFVPGEKLDDYFEPSKNAQDAEKLDVHGNQYGLLANSKCFKKSMQMNCSTCHNVHQNERNSKEVFVQRCMSCHSENKNTFCTVKNVEKPTLMGKCIDCHMPLQASNQIVFETGIRKKTQFDSIRTHNIKIFQPKETTYNINSIKKYMKSFSSK
jgi:hypothetical protein